MHRKVQLIVPSGSERGPTRDCDGSGRCGCHRHRSVLALATMLGWEVNTETGTRQMPMTMHEGRDPADYQQDPELSARSSCPGCRPFPTISRS